MSDELDCIVCGSCVVDLLCRPAELDDPIGRGVLHEVGPLQVTAGGITSNAGVTMARLGMKVAAFSYLGDDAWAPVIGDLYTREGVRTSSLMVHPSETTSTTVVMIEGGSGERSFYHCVGAPRMLDAKAFLDHLDLFRQARMMLLGYYSLLPNLEEDLPQVLSAIREGGCRTALDAGGSGGAMQPLDRILPHLDLYIPSLAEALHQTGLDADVDPRKIIGVYRDCGAPGLIGVKLGSRGVLLSPCPDQYIHIAMVTPPGDVVDTTGAGDSFYAGLVTGLLKGLSVEASGKLAAAAAACCVTALGGSAGGRDYRFTAKLAGIA